MHNASRYIRFTPLDVVATPWCLSTGCGLSTQVRRSPSTGTPQDGRLGVTSVTQGVEVTNVVGVNRRPS